MPARVKRFMDATCEKCGTRIGWFGNLIDRPPCGNCGHAIDPEELKRSDAELERMLAESRAKILERAEHEWRHRTPEQGAAFEEGRKAYVDTPRPPGSLSDPLLQHHVNSYFRLEKENPKRALGKWFARGWNNAESERYQKRANK